MQLTSLLFLYIFLPVVLAAFILSPPKWRPFVLFAGSLLWYYLVEPVFFTLLVSSVFIDYAALRLMEYFDRNPALRTGMLLLSVSKALAILYYTASITQLQRAAPVAGVLVYSLSGIDCVVGLYRREAPYDGNFLSFALYCAFFPRLQAGPLLRYGDFARQLEHLRPEAGLLLTGLEGMLFGMVKVSFLSYYLGNVYRSLFQYGEGDVTVLSSWMMVLALALSVYYQYSGWCDIARGVGQMVGITLPKNYYYPYQSRSVRDFFQRFNSTYSSFLSRLFHGVGQRRRTIPVDILCTLLMGGLFGVWFDYSANMLAWGIMLALLVLGERYIYQPVLDRLPVLFTRGYTFLAVMFSFSFYGGESLGQSKRIIWNLLGVGDISLVNNRILYFLTVNWLILVLGCFLATNVFSLLDIALKKASPRLSAGVAIVVDCGLLVAATALAL